MLRSPSWRRAESELLIYVVAWDVRIYCLRISNETNEGQNHVVQRHAENPDFALTSNHGEPSNDQPPTGILIWPVQRKLRGLRYLSAYDRGRPEPHTSSNDNK